MVNVNYKIQKIRQKRTIRSKRKTLKMFSKSVFFAILVLLVIFLLIIFKNGNLDEKLIFAEMKGDGSVQIRVLDPSIRQIFNINIPGETEVRVSRNYGLMMLKNVWRLSLDEGLEGKLLAETLTRFFKFPVYFWSKEADKSNLSWGDKLKVYLFSISLGNSRNVDLDLEDLGYIKKTILVSGVSGYSVTSQFPKRLLGVFSDKFIAKGTTVALKDATGNSQTANEIAEILEVLGAKVVAVDRLRRSSQDCKISGKNRQVSKKVSLYFDCQIEEESTDSSFDLQISLGGRFADRF